MAFSKKRLLAAVLTGLTAAAVITPVSLADDYSYVNAEHLNVRGAGTVRAKIVATVDKGYRVTVLEAAAHGWKHVLLENGQDGYVFGKYLSSDAPYYEKVTSTVYSVKVAHAYVRSDGLQKKIAVLNAGDKLEAVSDRVFFGRWIRVRVAESGNPGYVGRVGYISKHLVEAVDGYQFAEAPAAEMTQDQAVAQDSQDSTLTDTTDATDSGTSDSSTSDAVPSELNSAPAADTGSSDEDLSKLLEGL